jgi:hypothetical protein
MFSVLGFGMRKLLGFVVLLLTLGCGLYIMTTELFGADRIYHIYFGVSGAILASWASYSLWIDFIAGRLGITPAGE